MSANAWADVLVDLSVGLDSLLLPIKSSVSFFLYFHKLDFIFTHCRTVAIVKKKNIAAAAAVKTM